jgi:2,4-dichlorophenol 6-monooxygenase
MPHSWLERDGTAVATHHLVRPGTFVLLAGADGETWCEAAAARSKQIGVPLDAYRVAPDGDLRDPKGAWAALRGHDDGGAILVRPDGHVAFRAPYMPEDPAGDLWDALDVALQAGATLASVAIGS